ncbi:putative transcriptional regulator [Kribbella flavida DSM 17836]|uniref:Putative transcriptional regulator n=1 Tax=Kribbella flavida (strain DSM 17836 / JCM 10339 / NBRC 14399) TaxID=479435 RepID=D2PRI6_KRIFD|nr:helix-turn-helix domain-containing protein [Kribbella flavida]ADB34904.1 putative transcriptional regulator [Kribbella flavida DSM 17836]
MSDNPPIDPSQIVQLDGRVLRALAHPMRNRIVGLLRIHGPQTATTLAGRLGVNSGATSYHLRQLAEAGLVEEDESRGNARDRWWKACHQGTDFDPATLLQTEPELTLGFLHGIGQTYAENMFRAIDSWQTLDPEWREATMLSDYGFHLRPDQLRALTDEVLAVFEKYRTDLSKPAPEGTAMVTVQLQAFPREHE